MTAPVASPSGDVRWRIATPPRAAAIAIVELFCTDPAALDAALATLGVAPLQPGDVQLRDLGGVDRGLACRWSPRLVHLMPHGGSAVVRRLLEALTSAGITQAGRTPSADAYPEAADEIEARMLATLARSQSPLAVDLLLDQPRRWRKHGDAQIAPSVLGRLIDPPLVVVRGPPNVGKSTLVNALVGRAVSIVADQPGTTRDHVGVTAELAGLVVRLLDLPGEPAGATGVEAEAIDLAANLAEHADLTLLCGDRAHPPFADRPDTRSLRVALKADLDRSDWTAELHVSSATGTGLSTLVQTMRDRLVPPEALADPRPWKFWALPD